MNTYHKVCCKCKITKSSADFPKNRSTKDCLSKQCKTCHKEYRDANKEQVNNRVKNWKANNPTHMQQWRDSNKDHHLKYRRDYHRQRSINDELYIVRKRIRTLIGVSIKRNGYSKESRTHEILGCSYDEFKSHIEKQFAEGMSWDNRDQWHIDHITPVSWGITEEEIIALNHYTNFQPSWAIDNMKKGNRFSG